MSMLIHRCACGHPSTVHTGQSCRHIVHCRCDRTRYGPSELIPTFDANGQRIERIIEPGSGILAVARVIGEDERKQFIYVEPGDVIAPACGCNECRAAFQVAVTA